MIARTPSLVDRWGRPITPATDALRPLTYEGDDAIRGNTYILDKPCHRGEISYAGPFVNVRSKSSRAEALSAELSLEAIDDVKILDEWIDYSVRAEVVWGIGGVEFQAECDWLNGTCISLVAETLRIRAYYLQECAPWDRATDTCPPSYRLSAGVGYGGGAASSNPARLTELVQIESPGNTVDVLIPARAISWTMQIVAGSTAAEVQVLGRGGLYAVQYAITAPYTNVAQHDREDAFPLRNGARVLRVKNMNNQGPLAAFVVFGLQL